MREGWFLLHRQMFDARAWDNPLQTLAWIDLISMADHRTGIVTASVRFLADRWRVPKSTVQRWIDLWVMGQQVGRSMGHLAGQQVGQLSIVNYAKYQHPVGQQMGQGMGHSTGQQVGQIDNKVPSGVNANNDRSDVETIQEKQTNISSIAEATDTTQLSIVETNERTIDKKAEGTIDVDAAIEHMFNEYIRIVGRSAISKPVRTRYRARMKKLMTDFGVQQLLQAWRGMANDPWLMGENPGEVKYCHDLDYALRVNKIDKFLAQSAEYVQEESINVRPAPIVEEMKLKRADGSEQVIRSVSQ